MLKKITAAILLTVSSMAMANEPICAPTDDFVILLSERFKENIVLVGLSEENDDHIISVWFNAVTGTMTVLKSSRSKGVSCVIESGINAKFKGSV